MKILLFYENINREYEALVLLKHELKKRGITDLKVVYSTEEAMKVSGTEGEKVTPGSVSFVPSVCGLIVASEVIKDLTSECDYNE